MDPPLEPSANTLILNFLFLGMGQHAFLFIYLFILNQHASGNLLEQPREVGPFPHEVGGTSKY